MVVDKFTKWIEAKPITNIRSEEAVKFFLNIIYRFGVPNCIITDHETNCTKKKFLDFCDGYGIRIDWASVGHPRTNGQSSGPMAWSSKDLSPASSTDSKSMSGDEFQRSQ